MKASIVCISNEAVCVEASHRQAALLQLYGVKPVLFINPKLITINPGNGAEYVNLPPLNIEPNAAKTLLKDYDLDPVVETYLPNLLEINEIDYLFASENDVATLVNTLAGYPVRYTMVIFNTKSHPTYMDHISAMLCKQDILVKLQRTCSFKTKLLSKPSHVTNLTDNWILQLHASFANNVKKHTLQLQHYQLFLIALMHLKNVEQYLQENTERSADPVFQATKAVVCNSMCEFYQWCCDYTKLPTLLLFKWPLNKQFLDAATHMFSFLHLVEKKQLNDYEGHIVLYTDNIRFIRDIELYLQRRLPKAHITYSCNLLDHLEYRIELNKRHKEAFQQSPLIMSKQKIREIESHGYFSYKSNCFFNSQYKIFTAVKNISYDFDNWFYNKGVLVVCSKNACSMTHGEKVICQRIVKEIDLAMRPLQKPYVLYLSHKPIQLMGNQCDKAVASNLNSYALPVLKQPLLEYSGQKAIKSIFCCGFIETYLVYAVEAADCLSFEM